MYNCAYAPPMGLRASISYATNRIRAELSVINSFNVQELKSSDDARNQFKLHVLEVAKLAESLIAICGELGGGNVRL